MKPDTASAAGVGHLALEPGIEVGIVIAMLPRVARAARAAVAANRHPNQHCGQGIAIDGRIALNEAARGGERLFLRVDQVLIGDGERVIAPRRDPLPIEIDEIGCLLAKVTKASLPSSPTPRAMDRS
jgi:hypothetical protein